MRTPRPLAALAIALAAALAVPTTARALEPHANAEIPSSNAWVATDITVAEGHCYKLTADGKWCGKDGKVSGPSGVIQDSPYAIFGPPYNLTPQERTAGFINGLAKDALLCQIEGQTWSFYVGPANTFVAPTSGKLHFRINDGDAASGIRRGIMHVALSAAEFPSAAKTFQVVGFIDAFDFLHITHEGLSWEYGGTWSRVGQNGGTFPTLVNGVCWWPQWNGNRTDIFRLKRLPAKNTLSLVNVNAVRGTVTIQQSNTDELVLRFADGGLGASPVGCTIGHSGNDNSPAPAATVAKAAGVTTDNVSVPCVVATSTTQPAIAATPEGQSDPIDRPAFVNTPKALLKSVTSVTAMMVHIGDDGDESGLTSDIIATVNPASRRGDTAGVGFARPDGDTDMKTAFEEAVRAVTMRYPLWQPGHIDVSFGEKSVAHGGPSAGTAFALLMLSTLEGFEIDPHCAVTGDITVDWKVRKVGGVTAKLHGATLDHCTTAVIPEDNALAFQDMALLYGNASLWNIHVFSISTLQDAAAIARTDRGPNLTKALQLFTELQTQLNTPGKNILHAPATIATLKQILALAPNDLSAKYLLAVADNTAPKTLTANGTLYRLSVIYYPYRVVLYSDKELNRTTLPAYITAQARKRYGALRPIANKGILPLIADTVAFTEAMDAFAENPRTGHELVDRAEKLDARFATMSDDHNLVESLVREGY